METDLQHSGVGSAGSLPEYSSKDFCRKDTYKFGSLTLQILQLLLFLQKELMLTCFLFVVVILPNAPIPAGASKAWPTAAVAKNARAPPPIIPRAPTI
jgi:hypothetical protein